MSLTVSGNVKCSVNYGETLTAGLGSGNVAATIGFTQALANGSGANSINECYSDSGTLAVSTPVTLTLSALTDDLSRTIAFTKVRVLAILNSGTADLKVGGAATHAWVGPFADATDIAVVKPGGILFLAAPDASGMAVTSGTSDQLKLDPGSTACDYKIVILGE